MDDMTQFIEGIPKAELHLHIEGTLEPGLKFELAARNGVTLPYETVEEAIAGYDFDSLTSFLVGYYEGMGVLIEEQDFYDLATAYFRKVADENLIYAEIFFDPQGHTSRGVPFANVINGLHRARQDAAQLGVEAQLIMCFLRDMSAESAMETLDQAEPYKDLIVAIGLDSDERDNPPLKFKEVYDKARTQGYHLTMHCDVDQKNTTEHIRQALFDIEVERIDHGVNSLDDEALTEEILERGNGPDRVSDLEHSGRPGQQGGPDQDDARQGDAGHDQLRRPRLLPGVHHRQPQDRPGRRRPYQGRGGAIGPQRLHHLLGARGVEGDTPSAVGGLHRNHSCVNPRP